MDRNQIWEIYKEIGTTERHFNDLQSKYRLLVSSWLLATFIGVGFVFTNNLSLPIDSYSLISIISFFGSLGILLLWNLDIMVYHRLLDSAFIEGVILENDNDWLPKFRTNALKSQKGKGVLRRVMLFYLGIICILQCIALISISLSISIENDWKKVSFLIIVLLVGIISNVIVITQSPNKLIRTLSNKN
jgi:hypothetical protein